MTVPTEVAARRPHWDEPGLRWMYLLAALPVLTDIIERGGWPRAPREWLTEGVIGVLISLLVAKARRDHLALRALSRADALTGLWNRRSFDEAIADDCARARRSRQPLSLVYIDLDNFKQVNDRAGHDKGDQVLRQLAAAIGDAVRQRVDRAFRLGGDEFALLLPGSTAAQADAVLARIRRQCERDDRLWLDGGLGLSAGVIELGADEPADAFVRRGDEAMYRAKQARRVAVPGDGR